MFDISLYIDGILFLIGGGLFLLGSLIIVFITKTFKNNSSIDPHTIGENYESWLD